MGAFLQQRKHFYWFQPASKIILGQTQAIFHLEDHSGLQAVELVVHLVWILILKEAIYHHHMFLTIMQGIFQATVLPLVLDSLLNKR